MKSSFWKTFLKGFVTILPLFITLYLVFWTIVYAESLVGGLLRMILPSKLHIHGLGIVGGFFLLYAVGLLIEKQMVLHKISSFAEKQISRIPVVNTFYSSLKSLIDFATAKEEQGIRNVVLVTVAEGVRLVGFVTGNAKDQLAYETDETDETDDEEKIVAVYLPMSYQIGGYTAYLPQSKLTPLDMSFEEATQVVLTAGIGKKKIVENGENNVSAT
jgi:uncharacterized membrane protein